MSSTKVMLIERLTKALNDNVVVVSPEKILALLPVIKSINKASTNRNRGASKGEVARAEAACSPLELDEDGTTAAKNSFAP